MTGQRTDFDLGVVLGRWMHDVAPGAVPVPVLEEAFARTMSSRQVRVYPWERLVGRGPRAHSGTAFALVAAVALLVALLAFGSLGGGFGVAPSPSPTSASDGCALGRAVTERVLCRDGLQQGQGCPSPFPAGPVTSTVFTPKLTFTAPAGYIGYEDTAQTFGVLTAHAGSDQGRVLRLPRPSSFDTTTTVARVTRTGDRGPHRGQHQLGIRRRQAVPGHDTGAGDDRPIQRQDVRLADRLDVDRDLPMEQRQAWRDGPDRPERPYPDEPVIRARPAATRCWRSTCSMSEASPSGSSPRTQPRSSTSSRRCRSLSNGRVVRAPIKQANGKCRARAGRRSDGDQRAGCV